MIAGSHFEKELQRRIEMALEEYDKEFDKLRLGLIKHQGDTSIPSSGCKYAIFDPLGDMRNIALERELFLEIIHRLAEYCRIECPYKRTLALLQYSESYFFDNSKLVSNRADEWIVRDAYRKATDALRWAVVEEAYETGRGAK